MCFVKGFPLVPIGYIRHRNPMCKRLLVNSYTTEGRELIHKSLQINNDTLKQLMKYPVKGESVEYNDNRISLYVAQKGGCAITGAILTTDNMHCHHKVPRKKDGNDRYTNLVLLTIPVHNLVHATDTKTIAHYLKKLSLTEAQLTKVNNLRKLVGNEVI